MSWTAPRTFITGEILTASIFNVHLRDNLIDLDRRTTTASAVTGASETTASTSFVDLATVGPAVTVTIGSTGRALVGVSCSMKNSTQYAMSVMGWAISGATTSAAQDNQALAHPADQANGQQFAASFVMPQSGLNSGSTTFTGKYKVTSGTGTFLDRRILVTPLGS